MAKAFVLTSFLAAILFIGCEKSSDSTVVLETVDAALINNIAVDGCEWHITLKQNETWIQLATSKASQSKVDAIIKSAQATQGVFSINVKLAYRLTGNKKDVQCGWGKINSFPEIEVQEITKK